MEAFPGLTPSQTRRRTAHFILGQPKDIANNCLPLEVDIFNYTKKRMDESNSQIQFIAKEVAPTLISDVLRPLTLINNFVI